MHRAIRHVKKIALRACYSLFVKVIYIPKTQIDKALTILPLRGKRNLEPFISLAKETGLPLQLLEDTDVVNDAEIHKKADDLWLCLSGEVAFICGGEMQDLWLSKRRDSSENPDEIKGKSISGGTAYVLRPGDWLWIPAGVPHQHSAAKTARLAIIKIPR